MTDNGVFCKRAGEGIFLEAPGEGGKGGREVRRGLWSSCRVFLGEWREWREHARVRFFHIGGFSGGGGGGEWN